MATLPAGATTERPYGGEATRRSPGDGQRFQQPRSDGEREQLLERPVELAARAHAKARDLAGCGRACARGRADDGILA